MSLNVGNISARFGLDPADFLEKLRGVSGSTKFFSDEMRRSMKETSREGAESFRLIDEALGVHISRPLTRLLTQEFPGFAKGLQSVLGIGAVGALATAGVEFFDKIAEKVEKAKKAQEELRSATLNVNTVFAQETSAYQTKDKAIAAATEKVNKLVEAQLKQTKASEDASGWWAHLLASIDEFATKATSFEDTLGRTLINSQLARFQQRYDTAGLTDSIHGTHQAMQLLTQSIKEAHAEYDQLFAQAEAGHSMFKPGSAISWETVAAAHDYLGYLKQIQDLQALTAAGERGKEAEERQKKVAESLAAFYREIGGASAKIAPDTDPIHKLEAEITAARVKAVEDFDAMRKAGASALNLDHALAALGRLEVAQDRVLANAKAAADVATAAAKLPANLPTSGSGIANSRPAPQFAAPTAMPTLGAGGTAGAQLSAFANDQAAQLKMAAQAYQDALTPQEKYKLGQQELGLLISKGLIDQNAYTAAMAQLDQQMVKAATSAHKLQEEMQKLLERSNDAGAGLKAYGIQLQLNAEENGKFIYDVLTAATKSGEDDAAKSLMMIFEGQRGGQRALIHDLEKMWSDYFKNIATMGMKNVMDRALAPLGKAITGGAANPSAAGAAGPEGAAKNGLLSWLVPKSANASGTAGGSASLSAAGTMLTHAGTELLSAAMALRASAGVAGGSGGGGGSSDLADFASGSASMAFFAAGGDATPGSSFISGESGAEQVDLDGRGGAHITPLGETSSAGDIHNHYDMRGSIVTDDVMRRSEAASAIRASEGRMMGAMPALQREISLRKRS